MKKFKKLMIVGMIALAALIGFQSSSNALTLGFYDGVGPFYIHDNIVTNLQANELPDQSPLLGVVSFNGALGTNNWSIEIIAGISKPFIGSADAPQIDLFSLSVTSGPGPHNLWIALVDSGFTGPISGLNAGPFTFAAGGTTDGSVSLWAFGTPGNTEAFGGTPILGAPLTFGPGAFSGTASGSFTSNIPFSFFSLGILANIDHTGTSPQTTSFDAKLTAVPEPSVILLMGVGLIGIWGFRKKFKK